MDYQVNLDIFRGPLDLLLYLVQRDEVDIFDIPIARITEQYLEHLEMLKLIDVERVGDFLVMASTLMEIKSKLLLPKNAEAASGEEDPRLELVRQLVEYKKYKEAAALLERRAEEQSARLPRQPAERFAADPRQQPIREVELWDLVSAFSRLMRETLAVQASQVIQDDTPVQVYMAQLMDRLSRQPRLAFADAFDPPHTRFRLVGLFLALLELIRARQVAAEQSEPFDEIYLVRLAEPEDADATASAPPLDAAGTLPAG